MGYLKRLGDKRRAEAMAFQVTINVTTREVVETGNPAQPLDVKKVSLVESKGEGATPEKAFANAYESSGLKEFVDLLAGGPRIVTGGFGGQA